MQITDEMVMAHAVEDAKFAGKSFDTLGRADRARYLERSRLCLTAALSAEQAQPVAVKALEIDELVEELLDAQQDINLAANSHMDQSLCDASALIDKVGAFLLRIRSALVDVPVEPVAWREIEGYEGLYEVSSDGDVRSIQTGKLLAKNLAGSGYVKADLWKNGKRWQTTVHRLVADAFLEKQGSEINHINGVKTDNRVENLEWCTRSENVSHSFYVLSKRVRPVEAYNPGTGEKRHYRSVCEAARDGFKSSQIYRALKNPNRTVKGFHWQEASPPLSREGEDTAEVVEAGERFLKACDAYVDGEEIPDETLMVEYGDALEAFRTALVATRSGSATIAKGGE